MGRVAEMMAAVAQQVVSESALRVVKPIQDLRTEAPIDSTTFSTIRRRAILEGCKWDPQVGDLDTLSPFPVVMKSSVWKRLARQAEQLTAEAISAEEEILNRPELLAELGLPRALRNALADTTPATPTAGRVIRFDFHYTTDGWQISEANSDVPGGFTEASCFTAMVAKHFPHLRIAGDPQSLGAGLSQPPPDRPAPSRFCPRLGTWKTIR